LAAAAGISRWTLNQLEGGVIRELGIRKVLKLLDEVGVEVSVEPRQPLRRPDYVRMACSLANVSFRSALTDDELVHALVTGKVPPGRAPHLRTLLDEAPPELLNGLASEAARWISGQKLEKNLTHIAHEVGASRGIDGWLTTD
jgi:hypothetical protein